MFALLVRESLRRRLLVLVVAALLVLLGTLSLPRIPVDVLPDLNKPTVTVFTEAPGLAPEEVEPLVSVPVESVMSGLPGVTRVRSVSAAGLSTVIVEFDWNTEILLDRQRVAERLAMIRESLPRDAAPRIGPLASIMGEVMLIALSGPQVAAQPGPLRWLADNRLRPLLLAVPGVALVTVIGGEVGQYRVAPDLAAMRQLGVSLQQIEDALRRYGLAVSGGFVEHQAQEYMLRLVASGEHVQNLRALVVAWAGDHPVLLNQIARVDLAPAFKRGDAGYGGEPAIILSVQKQPQADTLILSRELRRSLESFGPELPPGVESNVLFEQARFIDRSVDNVLGVLRDAALIVTLVLLAFLLNLRTTLISLTAIPLSILVTVLVFRYLGLSINTMTLGGIAIAIGELVDDAVVDVENILRRLRQSRLAADGRSALVVILAAVLEVRTGVLHATLIVVLAFAPLFALPGVEGRLFTPLGVAYIVSILASLLVAMTLTPALSYYLLRGAPPAPDGALLRRLKLASARSLSWSFDHFAVVAGVAVLGVVLALAVLPQFDRIFLPPFNEDTLTVNLLLQPGTALAASNQIGQLAERRLLESPLVRATGRRTGRAELDDHAEGVHYSELDVDLRAGDTPRAAVLAELRQRLELLPGQVSIGSPIAHRIDHLLSGVRAQLAVKLFGDDLDTLRDAAEAVRSALVGIDGLVDMQVQRQVHVPQLQVRIRPEQALAYGASTGDIAAQIQTLTSGRVVSRVIEAQRHRDVVIRVDDAERQPETLEALLIETPIGRVPLSRVAEIVDTEGPSQIAREKGRRVLTVSANTGSDDMAQILEQVNAAIIGLKLPESVRVGIEGALRERERATRQIALLGLVSLALILLVLYSRYGSLRLSAIILINVPLALVGSVVALALSGQPLSLASLVGFITLTGIATRNGILKLSHYVQLIAREGETFGRPMIVRGSLERLAPVLMTSLGAALALLPLLLAGDAPGKEILHPVAVVIFGGLLSATLLDTLLTPTLVLRYGERALQRLVVRAQASETF